MREHDLPRRVHFEQQVVRGDEGVAVGQALAHDRVGDVMLPEDVAGGHADRIDRIEVAVREQHEVGSGLAGRGVGRDRRTAATGSADRLNHGQGSRSPE